MEPLDPAKNNEGSGFSKRRISSILKTPRRSVRFPEPQQQEHVVECAKPVEKRISRRVSFAPANDVLLFSKDVKSASPARSPLQELITTTPTATPNRVQVEVTEDGIQQIMGMETLLNAPLHASQQRETANFDTGHDLGEKTVMFSTDDAFMEMTHSHTINIADDADVSLQSFDSLTTSVEKRVKLTANDGTMDISLSHNGSVSVPISRNMDLRVEKSNVSSSALTLDPGFENFLASLSNPSDPSVNPVITTMASAASTERTNCSVAQVKTQRADVGKENQAPTSVSAVMEKSLGTSRKIGELSYRNALCPEVDLSMDMTEAQTGRILGFSDDDDPFQCLFPTQEMYSRLDSRVSQTKEKTKQQQISKPQASLTPIDMTFLKNPSLKDFNQRHKDNLDTADECREKTIMFTAGDEIVDMTQSHTVNIGLFAPSNQNVDTFLIHGKMDHASSLEERKHDTCGTPGSSANFLSSFSTPGAPSGRPAIARMVPSTAASSRETVDTNSSLSQLKSTVGKENQSLITTRVSGESFNEDMYPKGSLKKQEMTSRQQHHAALESSNRKGMDTSLTASLKTKVQKDQVKFDDEDDCREKTVRFSADDACIDVTRSHTVNIVTDLQLQSLQNVDIFPACGEKTVRFSADDACIDVTRSHTVNIVTDLQLQSLQNVDIFPACGEKTVRFSADDACIDVTRSHTVNIVTDLQLQSPQNVDFLPACGEKTVRFSSDDACIDVTRSHTVNIDTDLQLQSPQNVDILPACGETTVRFTGTDAAMDVTQNLTVKFHHNSASDHQDPDILSSHENMNFPLSAKKTHLQRRNRSLSAYALDPGFKNSLSETSGPWANPVITRAAVLTALSPQKTEDGFLHPVKTQKPDLATAKEAPAFVSSAVKKPIHKTMMEGPEHDVSMEMNKAQTCCILGQTDEPPQCPSSTQDLCPNSDHLTKTEVTSQLSSEALGSSNLPDCLHSNETVTRCEPRNQTRTLSEEMENSPSAVNHDVDAAPSRKSRRISLADLQSQVRRLNHIISAAPVTIAMEAWTAPLPRLDHEVDKNSKDETKCRPVTEPELEMGLINTEENTQDQSIMQGEQPFTATTIPTPFNLKTKQLMSRLSVGSFKAKLPQGGKDPKKQNSVGEHTRTATVNVTNKLSNFDNDLSNIYNEELESYEDMSESLDMSPPGATEEVSASYGFHMDEPLEDNVFKEDFISSVHGKKRPLPVDENNMEDEKRKKTSTEAPTDVETSHVVESLQSTQTTDYSNSIHTASIRCEPTCESTFKQSLFESQLEDYTSDLQRKLSDGNITVSEFFKLFNIDFVIHNPRQSILPARLLSDTDCTPMDLLKDRHIYLPKQMVYETDVLNLTEKVEGLKGRMRDLDKPLKMVNRALWEEVRNSSEKELKSFGAKLKERNNLFRKLSKVQSHEMKEVLYSNIVQASLEEQQRSRGTIEEADAMLKSLDDCIHELETELTAVEEKGFEDKPSLKSRQEEMQKVTEALADNDQQIAELEAQKKQNSNTLNRLKAEARNLENHVDVLHRVNEWKCAEKTDNCTTYTFLHETLHLELVYEESSGNDAGNQSERKILHLTFKLQLDDEKSQGHACLVHTLLSEYIEGESDWLEKYPTSRHVPTLLHDVGLVVSRCRLLGEELRLLKLWGGLRLDILNISCVDTRVHIVFSRLKTFSKFEVTFSVSLMDCLCVLQVQSFKNMIGNTTIQQIEEIVASFSPAKNLLTKIIKTIHENLLC
ncbi:kinetochore scaffold 1 isoform X3 [Cyclopterus lumpus]|uniref:kinetochore scaffold 1 isoform X3 n=1 Tax=Cyclopterus lumpus TaxID=8103 RepID=UPI001486E692|nr:kinetochore scaffold 1 isoform X3 [Cyclopterus lumpus]